MWNASKRLMKSDHFCVTRGSFHQWFVIVITIPCNVCFSETPLHGTIQLQNFVDSTTAALSCHVQNFWAISSLQLRLVQNEIYIDFVLSLNGPALLGLKWFLQEIQSCKICIWINIILDIRYNHLTHCDAQPPYGDKEIGQHLLGNCL